MKNVFVFGGQGSQYHNMGKYLFDTNGVFRNYMIEMNQIHMDLSGVSILDKIYGKFTLSEFSDISHTHPAIFMVEYSLYQLLLSFGIYPDIVVGSSLGEFASCAVAGVADYKNIFISLIRQASLIKSHFPKGTMISILHNHNIWNEHPILRQNSEIVSINGERHFTISILKKSEELVIGYLRKCLFSYQKLDVNYPFHSSFIDHMEETYVSAFENENFKKPNMDFISSVTGKREDCIDLDYLWRVVRNPIRFIDAVSGIMDHDISVIDLSPASTLVSLLNYCGIFEDMNLYGIMSPYHNENKNLETLRKGEKHLC